MSIPSIVGLSSPRAVSYRLLVRSKGDAVLGAGALSVPAQVHGDGTPAVLREPRPNLPLDARGGYDFVHEQGEWAALLAPTSRGQLQSSSLC